jgi:hypothetical protein
MNPTNSGGELRCSGRVSSYCSTSDTSHVNLVTNICYKFVLLLHVTYVFFVIIGSQLALDNPRLNMLKFIYGHLTPAKIQDLKNACQQEVKKMKILTCNYVRCKWLCILFEVTSV